MKPCLLCSPELGPVIAESENWHVVLSGDQNFLGRCMCVLRRHIESVAALTPVEWAELHVLIQRSRRMQDRAFQPDHYNYVFLQNQDRHVHMHLIPRYKTSRVFEDMTFEDRDWPGHYSSLNAPSHLSAETMTNLADHLTRLWSETEAASLT